MQNVETQLPQASSATRPSTILVVDDDPTNLIMAQRSLEHQGYKVVVAEDGPRALSMLTEVHPDLIILDYMMPGMDGPEVLRKLRVMAGYEETPVLLLTSSSNEGHIGHAFTAGAQDFITRPVNWRVLGARIAAAIDLRRTRQNASEVERRQEALLADLHEAQEAQRAQLPTVPALWSGWRSTGVVLPSGSVGGDVFTFVHREGAATTVALVDVCGHGVAAALIAAWVSTELRAALVGRGPGEAMAILNTRLEASSASKYAVVGLVETHPDHVTIVNAGLPPIALMRNGNLAAQVEGTGIPPGLLPDQVYSEVVLNVEVGDVLLLVSDGLTEPFGHADDVRSCAMSLGLLREDVEDYWAPGVLQSVVQDRLGCSQPDDATVVLLERFGEMDDPKARLIAERTFDACTPTIPIVVQWIMSKLPNSIDRTMIDIGVTEAVTNAVVHGALDISSDCRINDAERYLESMGKAVAGGLRVAVRERDASTAVLLSWDGASCPEEHRHAPNEEDLDPLQVSGRGLLLIYGVFDEVRWGDDGLSMELVCVHQPADTANES